MFLKEIKELQDKLKKKAEQNKNFEKVIEEKDQLEDEIEIPFELKPFLNKEINFTLFVELLTEKVDEQRVAMQIKQF